MDGVHYEIQATDPTEMDLEVLKDRANWSLFGKMLFILRKQMYLVHINLAVGDDD